MEHLQRSLMLQNAQLLLQKWYKIAVTYEYYHCLAIKIPLNGFYYHVASVAHHIPQFFQPKTWIVIKFYATDLASKIYWQRKFKRHHSKNVISWLFKIIALCYTCYDKFYNAIFHITLGVHYRAFSGDMASYYADFSTARIYRHGHATRERVHFSTEQFLAFHKILR